MSEMSDFNANVIEEFRSRGGIVGGIFEGAPMLLLHHTGARSATEYVTPLVYLPEAGDYFIFASAGGAPRHPGWYHNLIAHPQTCVEVGAETVRVLASEVIGLERDRLYAIQASQRPGFADYAERTAGIRTIPVMHLAPARAGH